jgi:hypothetical protein
VVEAPPLDPSRPGEYPVTLRLTLRKPR